MEKIIIIDKPKGCTSYDVVARIKHLFPGEKVGHAGTLDPMATGVLVILVGTATKRQDKFLNSDKEYEAEVTFGKETDTYDAHGAVVNEAPHDKLSSVTKENLLKTMKNFTGEIQQTVPAYSAVKIKGKRLYSLARKNIADGIALPVRSVIIKDLILLDFIPPHAGSLPKGILHITCSKGTYIRSLAHDLGEKLGCGAHLSQLRRLRSGDFTIEKALTLEEFESSLYAQ